MIMQRPQFRARPIPPCPEDFEEQFILGGWRQVERVFGARTKLLLKWIDMCGGQELYDKRKAELRERRGGIKKRKLEG